MEKFISILIWGLAAFGTYGTVGLVGREIAKGDICPKILGIPACYIVAGCFVAALIGHLLPHAKGKWIYFFFIGIVTVIASTGTIGELTGMAECPRTAGGTPMCFISLAICLSLLGAKFTLGMIKK